MSQQISASWSLYPTPSTCITSIRGFLVGSVRCRPEGDLFGFGPVAASQEPIKKKKILWTRTFGKNWADLPWEENWVYEMFLCKLTRLSQLESRANLKLILKLYNCKRGSNSLTLHVSLWVLIKGRRWSPQETIWTLAQFGKMLFSYSTPQIHLFFVCREINHVSVSVCLFRTWSRSNSVTV